MRLYATLPMPSKRRVPLFLYAFVLLPLVTEAQLRASRAALKLALGRIAAEARSGSGW
jgi:hypothetical protein